MENGLNWKSKRRMFLGADEYGIVKSIQASKGLWISSCKKQGIARLPDTT
jgi:hypothetical protein